MVINGAGAAALACASFYQALGFSSENIRICDSRGAIYEGRDHLNPYKAAHARPDDGRHTLAENLVDADILVGGNLKYLLGLPGVAFIYVKEELAERFEPALTGWFGRVNPFAFEPRQLDYAPGARRFEAGTLPV